MSTLHPEGKAAIVAIENDIAFMDAWRALTDSERSAIGSKGFDRFNKLTPYVGQSARLAQRGAEWLDSRRSNNSPRGTHDAVEQALASVNGHAAATPESPLTRPNGHHGDDCYLRRVHLLNGAEIKPEPVIWYWHGWLARGKFHVMAGAPGTGKTTIALALAATISSGGHWPDGTSAEVGSVLIWSGEDDPTDTLAPRLIAMGADMSRIFFVGNLTEAGKVYAFDPARDTDALLVEAAKIGDLKLLIVDPIVSAVAADSHKNGETRRALQPLVDLGARLNCAVLGISHFSKGTAGRDPVERVTGSLAFGALARLVWAAAKMPDDQEGGSRLLARAKSNIGLDTGGFRYDLEQAEVPGYPGLAASCVRWGKAVEGTARDLLAIAEAPDDDGQGGTLSEAKHFLAGLLSDGPLPSKVIKADADGAGYSYSTVRRAQKALGVEAVKEGMRGGWVWKLPPVQSA